MKLLSTVAAGALLLAGCAPFEHGHYAADSHFINDFGDRAGTPVLFDTNSDYAATATTVETVDDHQVHSAPAPVQVYAQAPIAPPRYIEPAVQPVVHSLPAPAFHHEPIHHERVYQEPIHQYVPPPEPVIHHRPPPPPPVQFVSAPPPVAAATSVSVNVNVDGNRYDTPTVVAPRQIVEERYVGETRYAPPEVVNMPPVYLRNGQQYSSHPYPAPGIPQFGAPPPFPAQGFGYPGPGFGGYGGAVPANIRPYQNGFNGGFNTPYGGGCVNACVGSSSVF